ncbi:uncharacterized protein PV09_05095 [Verruconis gallopava]|uniref:Protein STE50 n=1 Tax=Verruconis gallopava TaxID=253628 RepID=A0A0D1YT23_9PEZI|nr:uncharacterized protein PV09_05095 [Verruconis gallopava]KIW03792.1 hypothetical protein PV09_05095 [Verruconis gallopava]
MSAYKVTGYREDSDADDEYERDSVFMSPTLPPEGYSASPTDSDGQSTEPTPTTYTHSGMAASPRGLISDWSAEQSADFVSGLGLPQYADKFVEEAITGDALMALLHSDLKEMGITSIGHRLTILKAVYDLKIKQHLPIEPDDYVPLSADAETQDSAPTQDDIARIINIIKDRDAELRTLREELVRISEENRKLREDVLPIIKDRKNRSEPLPTPDEVPDVAKGGASSGLSRKYSTKRLFLSNNKPNNLSPTSIQESRLQDSSSLDPSAAAVAATNHLTASMRDDAAGGRSPNAASQPSPTSPAYSSLNVPSSGGAKTFDRSDSYSTFSTRDKEATTPSTLNPPSSARENPQVEIFKSFRVSIEDPCHKVLPVALKKYNITADWRQYALYIVHGDQERCLGLNEKPLILFKQLDREGRKPMFMLRKHASPMEGISSTVGEGGAQAALAQREAMQASGGGRSMQLPGGVL